MSGQDLHAGISEINTNVDYFEFESGIYFKKIYAHLMSHTLMAFKPAPKGKHHPAPWKSTLGGYSFDILGELTIKIELEKRYKEIDKLANIIIFLFKLGIDPGIRLTLFSTEEIQEVANLEDDRTTILPFETGPKFFQLTTPNNEFTLAGFDWVKERYSKAYALYTSNSDFALAVDAINTGQYQRNQGLTLISLWAALESIFSPSNMELKFRISSQIAAYLEPFGQSRYELQKKISKLYDKRSAAAHGRQNHNSDDLFHTFVILREVLTKMIDNGKVPSKEELEKNLYLNSIDNKT